MPFQEKEPGSYQESTSHALNSIGKITEILNQRPGTEIVDVRTHEGRGWKTLSVSKVQSRLSEIVATLTDPNFVSDPINITSRIPNEIQFSSDRKRLVNTGTGVTFS